MNHWQTIGRQQGGRKGIKGKEERRGEGEGEKGKKKGKGEEGEAGEICL